MQLIYRYFQVKQANAIQDGNKQSQTTREAKNVNTIIIQSDRRSDWNCNTVIAGPLPIWLYQLSDFFSDRWYDLIDNFKQQFLRMKSDRHRRCGHINYWDCSGPDLYLVLSIFCLFTVRSPIGQYHCRSCFCGGAFSNWSYFCEDFF